MVIYKQYDQAALDRQYNNRLQVPEWAEHLERWERTSREAEKKYSPVKDIVYGERPLENLDIFSSSQPNSKVLVFIHGGYWHKLDKSDFQFFGAAFLQYDITTVVINYPLAPVANMDQIVDSCRLATRWVIENIYKYNGDPGELYIAGYSAGAHLATMIMTESARFPDWQSFNNNVKGVIAMSGLYDLYPISLSEINQVLHLHNDIASRNSPRNLRTIFSCPLLITVGENESDEFKEQSEDFFDCWCQDLPMEMIELKGVDHYSIIEEACMPGKEMHELIKRLMGI